MSIYIRIDNPESVRWLKTMIDNTYADPNSKPMRNSYEHVYEWHQALNDLKDDKYFEQLTKDALTVSLKLAEKPAKPVKKATKKTTAKRRKKKEDPDPYACKTHPTYSGLKQVPRSDCVKCWELYKQFHPMDYPMKRRAFERKQANAAKAV